MEKFTLDEDIKVLCEPANSYPDGVLEAHKELHSIVPFPDQRRYFGISRHNGKGIVDYDAAAEEIYQGEAEELGCATFVIESGQYISLLIPDYMRNIPGIGKAFHELTAHPDIDPDGYCIEWYLDEKDVRCMVRLVR